MDALLTISGSIGFTGTIFDAFSCGDNAFTVAFIVSGFMESFVPEYSCPVVFAPDGSDTGLSSWGFFSVPVSFFSCGFSPAMGFVSSTSGSASFSAFYGGSVPVRPVWDFLFYGGAGSSTSETIVWS
jgi:hypothetical protein